MEEYLTQQVLTPQCTEVYVRMDIRQLNEKNTDQILKISTVQVFHKEVEFVSNAIYIFI